LYTTIPHDFGRSVLRVIGDQETVDKKFELMNMLNDIQIAVAMDANAVASTVEEHPLDKQYRELGTTMEWVGGVQDHRELHAHDAGPPQVRHRQRVPHGPPAGQEADGRVQAPRQPPPAVARRQHRRRRGHPEDGPTEN
jgi:hypothetical protein